jgi:hypothetical protein
MRVLPTVGRANVLESQQRRTLLHQRRALFSEQSAKRWTFSAVTASGEGNFGGPLTGRGAGP